MSDDLRWLCGERAYHGNLATHVWSSNPTAGGGSRLPKLSSAPLPTLAAHTPLHVYVHPLTLNTHTMAMINLVSKTVILSESHKWLCDAEKVEIQKWVLHFELVSHSSVFWLPWNDFGLNEVYLPSWLKWWGWNVILGTHHSIIHAHWGILLRSKQLHKRLFSEAVTFQLCSPRSCCLQVRRKEEPVYCICETCGEILNSARGVWWFCGVFLIPHPAMNLLFCTESHGLS